MNNVIHKFDYNVDRKLLLSEFPITNQFSSLNSEWKRSFELGTYGKKIENSFIKLVKGKASAGYYFQSKEISILEHLDTGCKCCININLTNDTTPIIINNTESLDFKENWSKDFIGELQRELVNYQLHQMKKNNPPGLFAMVEKVFSEINEKL